MSFKFTLRIKSFAKSVHLSLSSILVKIFDLIPCVTASISSAAFVLALRPARRDRPFSHTRREFGRNETSANSAFFFFRQFATSSQVTGVETVGSSFARKRIDADRCFVFVVLAPIDKYFSFPQRFRHVRSNEICDVRLQMLGESARQIFGLIESGRRIQRHINLQTLSSRSFWPTLSISSCLINSRSQSPTWQHCTMSAGAPGSRSKTIMVGRATSFFFAKRSVQLEIGEIRGPDQRRQILRETIMHVRLIAFTPNLRRLHPFRPMRSGNFFRRRIRASTPFGITLHRQRSIFEMRQENWRDPDVVIDHLAFGEPDFRVKNLVKFETVSFFPSTTSSAFSGIQF